MIQQSRRQFLTLLGLGTAASISMPWWAKFFEVRGRSMIAVPQSYQHAIADDLLMATSREDLLDAIAVLSPMESPLFKLLQKGTPVFHEWVTDELDQIVPSANVVRFLPRPL